MQNIYFYKSQKLKHIYASFILCITVSKLQKIKNHDRNIFHNTVIYHIYLNYTHIMFKLIILSKIKHYLISVYGFVMSYYMYI